MGRYTSNSMVVLLSHCLEGLTLYTVTVLNGNIAGHVPWNSVMGVDTQCKALILHATKPRYTVVCEHG